MFGYTGLLMFKIACIYSVFTIYYKTITDKNIGDTFSPISDKYNGFHSYTIKTIYSMKKYISERNYKINKIIDNIVSIYPVILDKGYLIYTELSENVYCVHSVLYESRYDIYVHTADYIYDRYAMVKLMMTLFNMNSQSTSFLGSFTQSSPEDTKKIINTFSDTLSALMMGLSSCEYGKTNNPMSSLGHMNNPMSSSGHMNNPMSSLGHMNNPMSGHMNSDMFMKLLKI
jgi:hypothetical protein